MQFTTIALTLFATLALAAPRPQFEEGLVNLDDLIITDNLNDADVLSNNDVDVPVDGIIAGVGVDNAGTGDGGWF
ncbi:hypothetical protein B0T21DRAFT_411168 [Apiosordaria backusii]|uniref:Uncharacterized protein n=1 Tax=Apiosordaria backusii TaxID=314023 RepID=A0AA40BKJ9_9PEZI|nr:hypothetical protein B0T21DRAFT_411168 [Apiosordaria backusii]